MTSHIYAFEAHSIQQYILDSGRLAEMVGASELVESLTAEGETGDETGLLARAQRELGLGDVGYSRRAGGMFTAYLTSADDAARLRDLWGLLVQHYAPGLRFSHAVASGEDEADAAHKARTALRQHKQHLMATHPSATPPVRRAPRSGLPATDFGTDMDEVPTAGNVREWMDRASHMKSAGRFRKAGALLEKFNKPKDREWPTLLDPEDTENKGVRFPFLPDKRYVGIVHADGNDLGALVHCLEKRIQKDAPTQYRDLMRAFSDAVSAATKAAAATAARVLAEATPAKIDSKVSKALPARPLVLGGDDLTIIVRGDCALDYTEAYLNAFEDETGNAFDNLKARHAVFTDLPARLSACAGVAFVKANQPFYLAYRLAEGMCDHAKQRGRAWRDRPRELGEADTMPSAIVFARITSSFIDRYPEVLEQELSVVDEQADIRYQMSLGAYAVGAITCDFPRLDALRQLKLLLARPDMARGPARKLLGMLHTSPALARTDYARWKRNLAEARKRRASDRRDLEFRQALQALDIPPEASLPYRKLSSPGHQDHVQATPLGDVLAWLAVDGSLEEDSDD